MKTIKEGNLETQTNRIIVSKCERMTAGTFRSLVDVSDDGNTSQFSRETNIPRSKTM